MARLLQALKASPKKLKSIVSARNPKTLHDLFVGIPTHQEESRRSPDGHRHRAHFWISLYINPQKKKKSRVTNSVGSQCETFTPFRGMTSQSRGIEARRGRVLFFFFSVIFMPNIHKSCTGGTLAVCDIFALGFLRRDGTGNLDRSP
jgi:hypothetical protein